MRILMTLKEQRLDDSGCTSEWIKSENRLFMEGFEKVGEKITRIDEDYNSVIDEVLKNFSGG